MINKFRRRPLLVVAIFALGLSGAGCAAGGAPAGGEPTVVESAKPESGEREIKDQAVQAAALRTVDPCALLNSANLAAVGAIVPDSHSEAEWGVCTVEMQAPDGKPFDLTLRVGDPMVSADNATDELEGLPLEVDRGEADSCFVTVTTSYETLLGITFQVDYVGGDPCAAGRTALQHVVRSLHNAPPQYQQQPGSTLTLDACAIADPKTLSRALGKKVPGEPQSLHDCDFWANDHSYPLVGISFLKGLPPSPEDGTPVDLGGGLMAIQSVGTDSDIACGVSWRHIETPTEDEADGFGEIVEVEYTNDPRRGVDQAGACQRAVQIARTIVPKLPKG